MIDLQAKAEMAPDVSRLQLHDLFLETKRHGLVMANSQTRFVEFHLPPPV
jgi:hypothetical protein